MLTWKTPFYQNGPVSCWRKIAEAETRIQSSKKGKGRQLGRKNFLIGSEIVRWQESGVLEGWKK